MDENSQYYRKYNRESIIRSSSEIQNIYSKNVYKTTPTHKEIELTLKNKKNIVVALGSIPAKLIMEFIFGQEKRLMGLYA